VLLLTPRWARDGGVGAHVAASAGALAGNGAEVLVLAARIESDVRVPGVTLSHAPALHKRDAAMQARVGEALGWAPDVAHLHQVDDPDIVDALRQATPVVLSAHGYTACTSGVHHFRPGHECARAHGPGCVPLLLGCAHSRNPSALPARYAHATRGLRALLSADLAVSYSSAVDRHLATNGVSRRMIVPYFPTFPARAAHAPDPGRRVVFAGRVVPAKGVAVLIRAARRVQGEFVICGDGRQLPALRRLARRAGVAERVRFTGWLSPERLADELAGASVVALPSVWPEPFGLVGIEAHAAGRPVVASDTGGVGDWLEHGVSGLMVAPGNARALAGALVELLADPGRQATMGSAGKSSVAARYSAQRHLSTLLDGYRAARASWQTRRGDEIRVTLPASRAAVG
jgi:glycosyltransferase involved in cell wall biosynthesis